MSRQNVILKINKKKKEKGKEEAVRPETCRKTFYTS